MTATSNSDNCQARRDPSGQYRCRRCALVWDADEVVPCGRLAAAVAEKVAFQSGLPEPLVTFRDNRLRL